MINKRELAVTAAENLKALTRRNDIAVKFTKRKDYDVDFCIAQQTMPCLVGNIITHANYGNMLLRFMEIGKTTGRPVLLLANYIMPSLARNLANEGIGCLDVAGNCDIKLPEFFIHITGQKKQKPKEKQRKTFSSAAIKLIFYFLLNPKNVEKTYRAIADETGFSLGTIKNVFSEMMNHHFITPNKGKRVLIDKEKLLEEWQVAYNSTLKPKLFLRRLKFARQGDRKEWQTFNLPQGCVWAGESGAFLTDGYLQPAILTIYAEKDSSALIRTSKFIPADDGDILVYEKFWSGNRTENIAPQILIYVDLMGTADSRCIEAAKKLLSKQIRRH